MARSALIVGGSGQIGRAVALRLAEDGWRVVAGQRKPWVLPEGLRRLGVTTATLDRATPGALAAAVGTGVDAVIDMVAYDESHARQLLDVQSDVGAFVILSSASVYRDGRGRSLDEARDTGFPEFPTPIGEDQPTVEPGPETYSTRKVALEQTLLNNGRRPVTILRPGAIHGPGSTHPREWFFVRRILDKRRAVPLAYRGASRFHTSATVNIAELCRAALADPRTRVLNAGDPDAPTVTEIGAAIAAAYDHDWRLIPMDGPPVGMVGGSPWAIAHPIVLDMSHAEAIGYRAVTSYDKAVGGACRSAEASARAGVKFPAYIEALFDYAAEDAWLAGRGRERGHPGRSSQR
ncbi:MAG: NAD-dependent epimerase/dehydratase family protein [Caulobacteraceae bacterium]